MIAHHQAETKLDLRLGGGGGGGGAGAGGLAVGGGGGGGGGHQAGPGPPSPAVVAEKPQTQPVINNNNNNPARSPPVPKPAPSPLPPAPAKPAPVRPPSVSYASKSAVSDNSVKPPPVHSPPPPSSPPAPAAPLLTAPPPRPEVSAHHNLPEPGALRQPNSLARSDGGGARGRTPTRQERQARELAPASTAGAAGGAANTTQGGYNFQKIMEDRFEHYKRPASRERSGSRQQLSRDPSRDRLARPGSRQRTPSQTVENSKANGLAGLDLDTVNTAKPSTGNGSAGGGGGNFSSDLRLPAEDQIRYRGVQQEIPHFGAPPKRTESLYMKPSNNQQATFKVETRDSLEVCQSS